MFIVDGLIYEHKNESPFVIQVHKKLFTSK